MRDFKAAITLVILSTILMAGTGCFRVSSELHTLGETVMQESGGSGWDKQVELSLGALVLTSARWGTWAAGKFVEVPSELGALLRAAKGLEITVHRRAEEVGAANREKLFKLANGEMEKNGWDRLLWIQEEADVVGVYVRGVIGTQVEVGFFVLNERELICASARTELFPLLELARDKINI